MPDGAADGPPVQRCDAQVIPFLAAEYLSRGVQNLGGADDAEDLDVLKGCEHNLSPTA